MDDKEKLAIIERENQLLKERIDDLSDFIENGTMPLHWVNASGIIIWANQAELDFLGYSREEYIGFPITDFHADENIINEILERLGNNETLKDFPAILRCKDGTLKYVSISSNVNFRNNEFVHTRCFTKDVTPLIKEEARKNKLIDRLKESEERLRLATEATNLGTWDWEFETSTIILSEQARKILNLQIERITTDSVLSLVHKNDQGMVNRTIKILAKKRSDSQFTFECRINRNEITKWIRLQGAIYFGDGGNPYRIIGSMMDITELKNSEQKDAELAAIVHCSNDAIIGKTLKGTITSWNAAAEHLFGYSSKEIVGQSILKLIPEDRKEEEDYILRHLRAGKTIEHFETKRVTRDGKIFDISLTISPILNKEGKIIGISKIARDITDKKQEERRKNDFVAMVSHELKTPLTSISLYVHVLQRNFKENNDERGIELGSKIESQTNKMITMIQDFLSLARIEEGKLKVRKTRFLLNTLFEEVKEEAELIESDHAIRLKIDTQVEVIADREKIGQVLINLLSNAIKYSPDGGEIILGFDKFGKSVRLYVQDQGVGISAHDQKKLFDRFFRVEQENISTIPGFGIGLYIVSEILRCHDTQIEVESETGHGSIFHFRLNTAG